MQPGWFFVSLRATFRPELAVRLEESCEFRIDGEAFHVNVDEGRLTTGYRAAAAPDVVISTDLDTFIALLAQRLDSGDALTSALWRSTATRRR